MPLKINVPYSDKDIAKSKGAFWDVEQKTWFVPDHKDINDFQQWINKSKVSVIIKSPVSIALNSSDCYKCANKTARVNAFKLGLIELGGIYYPILPLAFWLPATP